MKSTDEKTKMSLYVRLDHYRWLWREKRIRERSIAWIVNQAIGQYRARIEKGRTKGSATSNTDPASSKEEEDSRGN